MPFVIAPAYRTAVAALAFLLAGTVAGCGSTRVDPFEDSPPANTGTDASESASAPEAGHVDGQPPSLSPSGAGDAGIPLGWQDAGGPAPMPRGDAAVDGGWPATATDEGQKCNGEGAAQKGCLACTRQGWVQGVSEGTSCTFRGIRYGKAPVGRLRWSAPEPAGAWQGVLDAKAFGAGCAQSPDLSFASSLSEDCLFLNVWTPAAASATPLPVIVFLHGGAFIGGAANLYGGRGLSEAGPVVVVSLNYRLGALGFFAHPALDRERATDPAGADGIRDQQLALRWVRDNVARFGGDPDNVTLMGESAGAVSVGVHMVSPGSSGLARRFVLESGAPTKSPTRSLEPVSKATVYATTARMVEELCPGADDVMTCLRALPLDKILAWRAPGDASKPPLTDIVWLPVVEGEGGVLPDYPEALIARGRHNRGEVLIGTNINEYALFQPLPTIFFADALRMQVATRFGAARADDIVALYKPLADTDPNQAFITLMTDVVFRCPARRFARLAHAQGENVYLYSFDHGGATHATELQYVLGPESMVGPEIAALGLWPATLVKAMQRYWTGFAFKGDPNDSQLPSWPRYEASSDRHMVLLDPPSAAAALQRKACDYWDQVVNAR